MKIIDISWPISQDTTAYKDKKTVTFEQTKVFENDNARESIIRLSSHTGTHIDAPAHFLQNGVTIDQVPVMATMGLCKVVDVTVVTESITRENLEQLDIQEGDIILLKTANSRLNPTQNFEKNFV